MEKEREENFKRLEEFVLVRQDKTPIYMEKDVKVVPCGIGKNGPEFEIFDKDGNKMGMVKDDKTFAFDENYKDDLKKSMGKMYDFLGFDKEEIKIDILEKIREQEEKNKEMQIKENKEIVEENNKIDGSNKNIEENQDKNEENKNNPKNKSKENEKDNKKEELTEKELKSYNNVRIKDFDFVADMISPNKYNIYDTYFINKDGQFEMVAQDINTGNYVKIEEYSRKETNIGGIDTIERNREETNISKGSMVAYYDRAGDRVEVNFRIGDTGEIEARVTSRNREGQSQDFDNDGVNEGIKIATDRDNSMQRVEHFDHVKDDANEEKKENYIETDEINAGPLTPQQIKEIISDKIEEGEITEKDEVQILNEINTQYQNQYPTKEELEEIISHHLANEQETDRTQDDEDDEWVPWKPRSH